MKNHGKNGTGQATEAHIEQQHILPPNIIGYRAHLSTQDALLALYDETYKDVSMAQLKAILAIDLKKAFDNVAYDAILEELTKTGFGQRMYNYVGSVLKGRTYTLHLGEIRSQQLQHPQQGIPQGSVLSPTLFNFAILRIHRAIESIANIGHIIYADDITLCVKTSSRGDIQETLQHAVDNISKAANFGI